MSFVISFLLFEILIPENENTEDGELEEGIEKEKISNHIQENGEGETGRYTCLYLLVSCFFSLSQIVYVGDSVKPITFLCLSQTRTWIL